MNDWKTKIISASKSLAAILLVNVFLFLTALPILGVCWLRSNGYIDGLPVIGIGFIAVFAGASLWFLVIR